MSKEKLIYIDIVTYTVWQYTKPDLIDDLLELNYTGKANLLIEICPLTQAYFLTIKISDTASKIINSFKNVIEVLAKHNGGYPPINFITIYVEPEVSSKSTYPLTPYKEKSKTIDWCKLGKNYTRKLKKIIKKLLI